MKATRAVAGLLLLALFLGTTRAGDKCANCGLGEGVDACNCGNSVIRSEKLEKPEIFASPEAIKNALKLKAASAYAARQTAPVYVLPTATYAASYAEPAATYGVAYNAVPAPSPVSYASLTRPSPPALSTLLRGKNYADTKYRNSTGSYSDGAKSSKDNEDLVSLLSLKPGTSIAPKFEPIGDLCRCNKCKYGNGDGIVGVVPARPGKLPPYKSRKPKSKSTTTPAPLPTYSTESPTPAYSTPAHSAPALSYSAPAPSYSVPTLSYTPSILSYSAPAPSYSVSTPSYTSSISSYSGPAPAPSYSALPSSCNAAAPSYIAPEAPSYSAPAPFYSAAAAPTQYAPAYQTTYTTTPYTPDLAQYAPANPQQSPQMIYVVGGVASSVATQTHPYVQPDYDKSKRETAIAPALNSPELAQYARAYLQELPRMIYQKPKATPKFDKEEAKITPASYTQNSAQYSPTHAQQPAHMIYAVGDAPTPSAKAVYEKTQADPGNQKDYKRGGTITPVFFTPDLAQYAPTHSQQSAQMIYAAPASHTPVAPTEYVPTYQQSASPAAPPAPQSCAVETALQAEKPSGKSKKQVDNEKDEQEAQTLVEIQLQKERTPRYTADPVSVSMAYKIIADSQGKKYVPEDSLAYGHYKEPADGRVNKYVSDFDEEKLHTVDKPVVELKDDEYGNLQISYRDIGFGPVAPSKNRFVPKTDDANNSAFGPTIIYVPPPEDKDSLPCGPLGPTIPGYKPGGVIHGEPSAKSTCGCGGKTSPVQEGTRRAVLVDADEQNSDSEEYEGGSDKGGIIERIKSSSCKRKKSE